MEREGRHYYRPKGKERKDLWALIHLRSQVLGQAVTLSEERDFDLLSQRWDGPARKGNKRGEGPQGETHIVKETARRAEGKMRKGDEKGEEQGERSPEAVLFWLEEQRRTTTTITVNEWSQGDRTPIHRSSFFFFLFYFSFLFVFLLLSLHLPCTLPSFPPPPPDESIQPRSSKAKARHCIILFAYTSHTHTHSLTHCLPLLTSLSLPFPALPFYPSLPSP